MKLLSLLMALVCGVNGTVQAANFDAQAVFGSPTGHDVDAAVKRGTKAKKVVLFTYDPKEGGSYPGSDITAFMELLDTKKLVKDNFIVVVLERGHKDLDRYVSPGAKEKAYYALINSEGKTVKTEMVYRNPDVGLKTVKEWVAMP
ncbi:MAG: hypothetical protein V4478_01115 [Patescibacteria group bacterium]